jgi:hypothetical protein
MVRSNTGKNVIPGKKNHNQSHPEPFDWYQVYTGIKDIITQYVSKTDKILNVGSGNSSNNILTPGLSEDMYEDGYENIQNIDISHTITKYMEDRCKTKYPEMKCNLYMTFS